MTKRFWFFRGLYVRSLRLKDVVVFEGVNVVRRFFFRVFSNKDMFICF